MERRNERKEERKGKRKKKNYRFIFYQGPLPPWLSARLCFPEIQRRALGRARCLGGGGGDLLNVTPKQVVHSENQTPRNPHSIVEGWHTCDFEPRITKLLHSDCTDTVLT